MGEIEFLNELKAYLRSQMKFLYEREVALEKECQELQAPGCFGPSDDDYAKIEQLKREADKCYFQRQAYEDIWRRVAREQELERWLAEVQNWLPQGQTR